MAPWLTITGVWIGWLDLLTPSLQSVLITIIYNNWQSIFSRTLLPWPPRSRSILVLLILIWVESYVTTDGQSASLSWNKAPIWGLRPDLLLMSDSWAFVDVGRSLWREDGSVIYNCCWPSTAQSFSGPSPVRLATIFCCLRFEASLFVASYVPQDYGGGIRPRLHTGWTHRKHTSCPAMDICEPYPLLLYLQPRCLAIDILFFRAFASAGMCLATRCLAIGMARTT
jgi:hypothetical protein